MLRSKSQLKAKINLLKVKVSLLKVQTIRPLEIQPRLSNQCRPNNHEPLIIMLVKNKDFQFCNLLPS